MKRHEFKFTMTNKNSGFNPPITQQKSKGKREKSRKEEQIPRW